MPANETMVPLMLNLVASGELSLQRLAEVTAEAPARLYGLYPRKGAIRIGSDGDFTIVDLGRKWTLGADTLIGKAGWTPFEGVEVTGKVAATVIRGRVAARDGAPVGPARRGRLHSTSIIPETTASSKVGPCHRTT
jgi:dihydroorotase